MRSRSVTAIFRVPSVPAMAEAGCAERVRPQEPAWTYAGPLRAAAEPAEAACVVEPAAEVAVAVERPALFGEGVQPMGWRKKSFCCFFQCTRGRRNTIIRTVRRNHGVDCVVAQ